MIGAKDKRRSVDQVQMMPFAKTGHVTSSAWGGNQGLVIVMRMGAVDLEKFVAVAASHFAAILGDRQPNAGMAQRPFATIAGNFPSGDDLNLGCGHVMSF